MLFVTLFFDYFISNVYCELPIIPVPRGQLWTSVTMIPNYTDWGDYSNGLETGEVNIRPDVSREIQLIIAVLTTSLGSLLNGLVLLLLLCRRDTRTLPFLAVTLLCLCDFVRNGSAILLIVGEGLQQWIFGDAVCKVTRYLHFCSTITSSWHLALAILVRYLATFKNTSCLTNLRFDRMVLFSLLTWLLVIIASIPVVITYSAWEVPYSSPKVVVCIFQADPEKSRALIISEAIVRFLLPFCALFLIALASLCKSCGPNPAGVCCTKTVIISTPVVFVGLQLPLQACSIYMTHTMAVDQKTLLLRQLADSLSYTSTVFNPILQAFTTPEFRSMFAGWWCCAKRYDANKAEKRARRKQKKRAEAENHTDS